MSRNKVGGGTGGGAGGKLFFLLGTLVLRQLYQDRGYGVVEFVHSVLDIHSKYENMVSSLFSNHRDFSAALDQVSITWWVTIATHTDNVQACRAFVNIPEKPRQQPKAPLMVGPCS